MGRHGVTRRSSRDASLDWLRGLLVLGVLLIHARGLSGTTVEMPIGYLVLSVGGVIVPVFFGVSGLLVQHTLARPWGRFLRAQWKRLVWPYLVWFLIGLFFSVCVIREWPLTQDVFVSAVIRPSQVTTAWYLWYAAVFAVVAKALRRMPRYLVLGALVAALLGGLLLKGHVPIVLVAMTSFFLGLEYTRSGLREAAFTRRSVRVSACLMLGTALGVLLVWTAVINAEVPWTGWASWGIVVVVGSALLASTAMRELGSRGMMQYFGRHSIIVYVVHWPVMLSVVWLRETTKVSLSPGVCFAIMMGLALAVCAFVSVASSRYKAVKALFEWPL